MKKLYIVFLLLFLIPVKTNALTSSESICLIDRSVNKVIYSINADKKKKTASIAKIMTAIVAIENGNLDTYIKVTKETTEQIGSKIYLQEDDEILLIDLIYGLMLRSGNDAAYLIAEGVSGYDEFVVEMNQLAKKIGMKNTVFENPSGLDEDTVNYSTACDMALLMSYAMENDVFREITGTKKHAAKTKNNNYLFINKHKLVNNFSFVTGGKTGYTKSAKRTLVTTAKKGDLELIVVSMNGPNDWKDHLNLFEYGFSKYEAIKLIDKKEFKAKNYLYDYIPYIEKDIYVPLSDQDRASYSIILNREYSENVGKIIVKINDEIVLEEPIYAYKPGVFEKVYLKFKGWIG